MQLKRVLGSVDAGWLVAGNMIGTGIFFTPGLVAGGLPGTLGPLLAWTLGGVLALCGAAIYAELGARLPRAGGDYQYLAVAFGPLWGFLNGWAAILATFSAAAAVSCIVAARYLRAALPFLGDAPEWTVQAIAPIIVLLLTLANVFGAKTGGRATACLTAIPLAGLLGMFCYGLLTGDAEVNWPTASASSGAWPLALGAVMLPVFFTYSGWNAAAYLAGEMRNPGRDLARGLLGGTAVVMLIYLMINAVFLAIVPAEDLAGSTTAGAQAARILLGPAAERVLSMVIALAVLGSANVTLMAGARIYYAMASDGLAPRSLRRTNTAGVPSTALWAGGIWSALLATTGRIETLVNWATLAILLLSSLTVTALFILRRNSETRPAFLCPGYPFTPAIYLVASLAVAGASAWANPKESLYGILLVALGFPIFALIRAPAGSRGDDPGSPSVP